MSELQLECVLQNQAGCAAAEVQRNRAHFPPAHITPVVYKELPGPNPDHHSRVLHTLYSQLVQLQLSGLQLLTLLKQ